METVCKMRFQDGQSRRARVKNLVPPLHFNDETTEVSAAFVEHVRKARNSLERQVETLQERMRDLRQSVRVETAH